MENSVFEYLSVSLKSIFLNYTKKTEINEIRIRIGQPLIVVCGSNEDYLNESGLKVTVDKAYIVKYRDIREIMEYISSYSPYAFEEELKNGYITINGGNRIGVCGKTVLDKDGIKTIRNITSINIRMARSIEGCSDRYMNQLLINDSPCHTLIVSPPCSGKTTFLRDLIRNFSDNGYNVAVVDERSEISGHYLGRRTDVLDGCPKAHGMIMLLRSMAPDVIAVDELGKKEDVEALEYCMNCGCTILATVHANDYEELSKKTVFKYMLDNSLFKRIVVMSNVPKKGTIVGIYNEKGERL